MSGANVKGLLITLGEAQYVLPALNAIVAREYWDRVQAMQDSTEPQPLDLVSKLVHRCLQRNYPELTEDQVAEHVDFDNMPELSAKVFGQASFRRWCEQQAAEAGNAPAPQQLADGTGAPSTPASLPPPAGDSGTSTS